MHQDVAIIIPSRIGSTRLARKSLEKIGNLEMVAHVIERALATGLANIFVATDSLEIKTVSEKHGAKAVLTEENILSGTDRVFAAYQLIKNDLPELQYIINLQGDMPFIDPKSLITLIEGLKKPNTEMATIACKVCREDAISESNVKIVTDKSGRALYFSRSLIPNNAEEYLYHIGAYGFKVATLEKFVGYPQTYLEQTERLEQLRALENGVDIHVFEVDSAPISVDTAEDLGKAISYYNLKSLNENLSV